MKLNEIFSDNMILQANKAIRIFGEGSGNISVEVAGKCGKYSFETENWSFELPSCDYGGPYDMIVDINGEFKTLKNIFFGDVYLLTGQSNIERKMCETNTPITYYKSNDSLRLFTINKMCDLNERVLKTDDGWKSIDKEGNIIPLAGELFTPEDGWVAASKNEIELWPAVGYLTGNELTGGSDRKIGLIACYLGASVIQSWLPEGILRDTKFYVPPEKRSKAFSAFEWNADGYIYEKMLCKLFPFSIKAVIWYQGEANTNGDDSSEEIYEGILSMLVKQWRMDFKDDRLPFIIIQIHDYIAKLKHKGWHNIQKAQENCCRRLSDTYLVKTADICESDDLHPISKLPVALRIAEILRKI